ncbi:PQQ-dependent dehydrogenase, methanol/ethanol family [Pseudomaricurvus alcaniphilus]|uniref:PQQ-dependent dehydrogenase, methanol/ethanol family n=1 Tax=Pseudomaricurvus alcaniphilus TaxID=1166482 RepID=UPI00140D00D2|nr:PQQ-dependent dehydrogenase, methanol/ethanol family [Pseudomaricurvus alcaniphilus]NHN36539.1 PQQ-dependent dehydrogenase, methanol/ethanol family [Pseudomaricurvus alcaniphilus]
MAFRLAAYLIFSVIMLTACNQHNTENSHADKSEDTIVSSEKVDQITSKAQNGDWPSYGLDYSEQRFSPLTEINVDNVKQLGLAWSLDLAGERILEATPLAIDGVLYFTGHDSSVYAVDAVKGVLLWKYNPEHWKHNPIHMRYIFPVNRGVAYLDGKVFVGTLDGRLVALDAKTGRVRWETKTVANGSKHTITGAPRAYKGKVVIGNGGGDIGLRGYMSAYDAETGKMLWRFYTVPGNPADGFENAAMEMAAKTWHGEYWKTGTGGTVWDSMTYDPELNQLYIGTGNSGPYDPALRTQSKGDNLFLASIVALNADSGEYIWHYQVNPQEAWDYKATANMILADLTIDGAQRKVVMQSPTNGFYYVIDRITGKLISAEKIGKVTWAERIDLETGRPVEAENIRYENGPVTIWPSAKGAHNWESMSFNPTAGLAYIPYMQLGMTVTLLENPLEHEGPGATLAGAVADEDDGTGSLLAWDPIAQKAQWKVKYPTLDNGGTMTTAGNLVFQGEANGLFHAYRADTGEALWQFDAKLGIGTSAITYEVDGTQYVSLLVGGPRSIFNHGWKFNLQPRRLLTFAIGGTASLPATAPADTSFALLDDPTLVIDSAAAERGAQLFEDKFCYYCHGGGAISPGGPAPDLRESAIALNYEVFRHITTSGALMSRSMPKYDDLSETDTKDIFMFIRAQARNALNASVGADTAIGAH